MPSPRPLCQRCNTPIRYFTKNFDAAGKEVWSGRAVRKVWTQWVGYPNSRTPLFCTLRCALSFATLAHGGGYRMTKGGAQ